MPQSPDWNGHHWDGNQYDGRDRETDGNRVTTVTNTTHASATSKTTLQVSSRSFPTTPTSHSMDLTGTRTSVESSSPEMLPTATPSAHHLCGTSRLFLRNGLLDPRASPERLRHLIPEKLPSNRPSLVFQFGQR